MSDPVTDDEMKQWRALCDGFDGHFEFDEAHYEDRSIGRVVDWTTFDDRLVFVPDGSELRDDECTVLTNQLNANVAKAIVEMLNALSRLLDECERLRAQQPLCGERSPLPWFTSCVARYPHSGQHEFRPLQSLYDKQRCETCGSDSEVWKDLVARHEAVQAERDRLRIECERLRDCLVKANASREEFERRWYLTQDERERMRPVYEAATAEYESAQAWSDAVSTAVDAALASEAKKPSSNDRRTARGFASLSDEERRENLDALASESKEPK